MKIFLLLACLVAVQAANLKIYDAEAEWPIFKVSNRN